MHKRFLAGLLSLLLILSMLPVGASAVTQEQEKQICSQITKHYYRTLSYSEMDSLRGYCGLLASWQLYFLGINKSVLMYDGNMQFDYYCTQSETSGGHTIKAYSAKDYTLEEALNAITRNGARNVYNILVGFQSTDTEAGSRYGHALVLYAIIDGVVYFTEGYDTALGTMAGQPIKLTIEEFASFYDEWTRFEGAVVFGNKDYMDCCTEYACHMIAEAGSQTDVYSLPATSEQEEESSLLRTVRAGERMLVTGLYLNSYDEYFYQVEDSGNIGYVAADIMIPEIFLWDQIHLQDLQIPSGVASGKDIKITGEIDSLHTKVAEISLEITSQNQLVSRSYSDAKASGQYQLTTDALDEAMEFDTLPEGCYALSLTATGWNYYLQGGRVSIEKNDVLLAKEVLYVGKPTGAVVETGTEQDLAETDGWFYRQNKLYYYEDGEPVNGWICYHGVDYYLQADGSVTTGWKTINGKARFFSNTGAMQTGWVTAENGVCYLLKNGVMAKGEYIIKGQQFKFTNTGWLLQGNT